MFSVLMFSSTLHAKTTKYDAASINGSIQLSGKEVSTAPLYVSGLKTSKNGTLTRVKGGVKWDYRKKYSIDEDGNYVDFTPEKFKNFDGQFYNSVNDGYTWSETVRPLDYRFAIKCIEVNVASHYTLVMSLNTQGYNYDYGFIDNAERYFYQGTGELNIFITTKTIRLSPGKHQLFFCFDSQDVAAASAANKAPVITYNFIGDQYTINYSGPGVSKSITYNYKMPGGANVRPISTPNQLGIKRTFNVTVKNENGTKDSVTSYNVPYSWNNYNGMTPDMIFINNNYKKDIDLTSKLGRLSYTCPAAPSAPTYQIEYDSVGGEAVQKTDVPMKFTQWYVYSLDVPTISSRCKPGTKFNLCEDTTITAEYDPINYVVLAKGPKGPRRYTVSFDSDGGSVIPSVEGNAVFDRWIIEDWYYDAQQTIDCSGIKKNIEAYATYMGYDEVVLPTTVPTKQGYRFDGWDLNGRKYMPGDVCSIYSSETLRAMWVKEEYSNSSDDNNTTNVNGTAKYKVTVKCKKQKDVKGYQFKLSTNKKFKKTKTGYLKTITTKKNKATFKKLPKKGKYYMKCRSYTMKGKKKVYSKWSKVKKITIK